MVTNTWLAVLLLASIVLSVGSLSLNFGLLGVPRVGAPEAELPITGYATGTASATVASVVSISLPVSTVSFGSLNNDGTANTFTDSPAPFTVRNDGTVNVNLTINATDLWSGTGGANPSSNYQFNTTLNETGSVVNATSDLTSTTNMPAAGSPATLATRLKFQSANDAINVEISITVPNDEAAGAKSSTVTITASQA